MVTKVQKWGNSQGLRLSKQLLDDAQISVGDEVNIAVRDGVIVVAPVKRPRGKHNLQELTRRIPKDYHAEELDWGRPAGKVEQVKSVDFRARQAKRIAKAPQPVLEEVLSILEACVY